jgi:hypothetical protein
LIAERESGWRIFKNSTTAMAVMDWLVHRFAPLEFSCIKSYGEEAGEWQIGF